MIRLLMLLPVASAVGCSFSGASPTPNIDADVGDDATPIDAGVDVLDAAPDPLASCTGLDVSMPATTIVQTTDDLGAIVGAAAPGSIIELAVGTHTVSTTITVSADDVTVRGPDPDSNSAVVIEADQLIDIFAVQASRFTIGNLRLSGGQRHVLVTGSADGTESGFVANNIHSIGAALQGIRGGSFNQFFPNLPTDTFHHDGIVFCSVIEPGVACENTAGVLVSNADNWRISKNRFSGYSCAGSRATQAVDSREPIFDRNIFQLTERAIRVGGFTAEVRPPCDPNGTEWSVLRGVVCNNEVYSPNHTTGAVIVFAQACETRAVHNSIYFSPVVNGVAFLAAEGNTEVILANNVSNGEARVDASGAFYDSGRLATNQLQAADNVFVDATAGLLGPVAGNTRVGSDITGLGQPVDDVCDVDLVGRTRDLSRPAFVGARER